MASTDQPLTASLLRELAEARLREALVLLAAHEPAGAYYLAGYAVELGLKARIARRFQADAIPDRRLVDKVHSHDLASLTKLAELDDDLRRRADSSRSFAGHWAIVTNWSEKARYLSVDRADAEDLLQALNDDENGIMRWIRASW